MDALLEPIVKSGRLPALARELDDFWRTERQRRLRFREEFEDGAKAEFIDGEIVLHSPARLRHLLTRQNISDILRAYVRPRRLGLVLDEKALCAFSRNDYEPDIAFFSAAKATQFKADQMIFPAPDLVVEVLSPSTSHIDRGRKFEDYQNEGVAEYWIVDADSKTLEQHVNTPSGFHLRFHGSQGILTSKAIAGLAADVSAFFGDSAPMPASQDIGTTRQPEA